MTFNPKDVLDPQDMKRRQGVRKKRDPNEIVRYAVDMYRWEKDLVIEAVNVCKRCRLDSKLNNIVPGLMVEWARAIINKYGGKGDGENQADS